MVEEALEVLLSIILYTSNSHSNFRMNNYSPINENSIILCWYSQWKSMSPGWGSWFYIIIIFLQFSLHKHVIRLSKHFIGQRGFRNELGVRLKKKKTKFTRNVKSRVLYDSLIQSNRKVLSLGLCMHLLWNFWLKWKSFNP